MLENIVLWILRFVYMIFNRTNDMNNELKTAREEVKEAQKEIRTRELRHV